MIGEGTLHILDRLIRGQAEIDRMRVETNAVVQTLIGVMPYKQFTLEVEENVRWEVKTFYGANPPAVRCIVADGKIDRYAFFTGLNLHEKELLGVTQMGLEGVVIARRTLSAFVDEVFNRYPKVAEKLRPILDAASV